MKGLKIVILFFVVALVACMFFACNAEVTTYKITLVAETTKTIEVAEGGLSQIEMPTKQGYIFAGWFYDEQYNDPFDISTIKEQAFTLYAKWITYSATFHFLQKDSEFYPNILVVENPPQPDAIDRIFFGWSIGEPDPENLVVFPFELQGDTHFFANYKDEESYSVNVYAEGLNDEVTLTASGNLFKEGQPVTVTTAFDNPEYAFDGWYMGFSTKESDRVSTSKSYTFSMPAQSVALNARWLRVYDVSVTYYYVDQTTKTDFYQVKDGYTLSLTAKELQHYESIWVIDGVDKKRDISFDYKIEADTEIIVEYQKKDYMISLNPMGGQIQNDEGGSILQNYTFVKYMEPIPNLFTVYKEGYVFIGWFDADGNNVKEDDLFSYGQNITLYAHFTPLAS